MPVPAEALSADAEGLRKVFDELMAEARRTSQQLRECHVLLLRLANEELFDARPVTGVVKLAARELLVCHGILAEAAEEPAEDASPQTRPPEKVADHTSKGSGF